MRLVESSDTLIHGPTRVSPAQFDPSDRTAMQQLTFEPRERQSRLGHHSIGAVIKLSGVCGPKPVVKNRKPEFAGTLSTVTNGHLPWDSF